MCQGKHGGRSSAVSRACRARAGRRHLVRDGKRERPGIDLLDRGKLSGSIIEVFVRLPPGEALEIAEVGIDHMMRLRSRAATTTGTLPQFPSLGGGSNRIPSIPARAQNRQQATTGCLDGGTASTDGAIPGTP